MFAKPKGKPKNDRGQAMRVNRSSRPLTMPDFLRSDPDGELAELYMRVKTASVKPSKLPAKQNRFDMAKRTIPDEFNNVRSPVGDYIRRSFISPASKKTIEESFWKEIPPVPKIRKEISQNATTANEIKNSEVGRVESRLDLGVIMGAEENEKEKEKEKEIDFHETKREELVEYKQDFEMDDRYQLINIGMNRKNHFDSAFATGIAKIQKCAKPKEVFECYAQTFHDVLELVMFGPKTSNVATQTIIPRVQQTQFSPIYTGFWDNCIWRQNRGVQTDEQNFRLVSLTNSNNSGSTYRSMKRIDWKSVVLFLFVSALFWLLLELKNL